MRKRKGVWISVCRVQRKINFDEKSADLVYL